MSELLSICIPTYNREKYLKKAIESIVAVINDLDVKVYIRDNASDDNTKFMMEKFVGEKIVYFRNEKNVGAIKNINMLFENAEGEYVVFLTDDDYFLPGGIAKLVDFIRIYSPDFVSSDMIVYLEKTHQSYLNTVTEKTGLMDDISIIADIFLHSHVLTRCCFKKSSLSKWGMELKNNSVYPHMVYLMDLIINKKKISYIAEPIVVHTWENEIFWELDFGKQKKTQPEEFVNDCKNAELEIIQLAGQVLDVHMFDMLCKKMIYIGDMTIDNAPQHLRYEIKIQLVKRKVKNIIRGIGRRILCLFD